MKTNLITAWRYLDNGHCAFKTAATSPEKVRCSHLFTVTGEHKLSDCPLIQPGFYSFQQQEGTVYIIEKNPEAAPASMWGFTTSVWRKFEQQFDMADLIRASEKLKEDDEDSEK
ncbi:MAG: hypothetical protein ACXACY_30490 [Candidatus Hodarchaeales archaeon]|jgi:hypothetical protein